MVGWRGVPLLPLSFRGRRTCMSGRGSQLRWLLGTSSSVSILSLTTLQEVIWRVMVVEDTAGLYLNVPHNAAVHVSSHTSSHLSYGVQSLPVIPVCVCAHTDDNLTSSKFLKHLPKTSLVRLEACLLFTSNDHLSRRLRMSRLAIALILRPAIKDV